MTRRVRMVPVAACASVVVAISCGGALRRGSAIPTVTSVETAYAALREADDAIEALEAGLPEVGRGRSLEEWRGLYRQRRRAVAAGLARLSRASVAPADARVIDAMRRGLERDLPEPGAGEGREGTRASCETTRAEGLTLEALESVLAACFGEAGSRIAFEGRTIDRLTALGDLATIEEGARRKALFLAMEPVWQSVAGERGAASPYRRLITLASGDVAQGGGPAVDAARSLGIDPAATEGWFVAVLAAWRDAVAPESVEPWDFRYLAGEASRVLSSEVPLEHLRDINDRYYRDLGADPRRLGVVYDLAPRPGKDAVAYTAFLTRGFTSAGVWSAPVARVSATYQEGGFDNLGELLHESGHALHVAAIRTRPSFEDWPDSDVFTEAWADVPAFELYEPAWQRKYLSAEAAPTASIRAKYASVVLDVAWGLFEARMLRDPTSNPNVVWTDITSRYLHIVPHPEWSWWAVRGQLVDSPGYMINYALGAGVTADIRERIALSRGTFSAGDLGWYGWVSEHLLRFGLERPASEVLTSFLGRRPNPDALLRDLRRLRG